MCTWEVTIPCLLVLSTIGLEEATSLLLEASHVASILRLHKKSVAAGKVEGWMQSHANAFFMYSSMTQVSGINNGSVAHCHVGVVQTPWFYHWDLGKSRDLHLFLSPGCQSERQEMAGSCKNVYNSSSSKYVFHTSRIWIDYYELFRGYPVLCLYKYTWWWGMKFLCVWSELWWFYLFIFLPIYECLKRFFTGTMEMLNFIQEAANCAGVNKNWKEFRLVTLG